MPAMREFFQRRGKFRPQPADDERGDHPIPEDLWVKCPGCGDLLYSKELEHHERVCPKCGHHLRLRARQRIAMLTDAGSFHEWDAGLRPEDPLDFVDGTVPYSAKLEATQRKSGEPEALVSGEATIEGRPLVLAVADFGFLGASMGSVFGEKLVRAIERAGERQVPLVTVSSSGGARMHEGMLSLMQMAKTVAALDRLGRLGVPHIALLTDPCYGGVTASYAMVADVIIAEPGALIGFAGPRVIEQITKQKLPDGFQTAEFLLEHGMIDRICAREEIQGFVVSLIDHYGRAGRHPKPWDERAAVAEAVALVGAESGG